MKRPNDDDPILPSDPRAATKVMIEAWQSREGQYFLTDHHHDAEDLARRSGASHIECLGGCGTILQKLSHTRCAPCREIQDIERHQSARREKWDGVSPVWVEVLDRTTDDPWELEDQGKPGSTLDSMRLYLMEPLAMHELSMDYWEECFPTDDGFYDVPDAVQASVELLNQVIRRTPPQVYYATGVAMDTTGYEDWAGLDGCLTHSENDPIGGIP